MTAEVRRGIVLALAGLLGGFAMVVALFGTGELLKRSTTGGSTAEPPSAGSETGTPLAALTPPPQGKTPGPETAPGASPERRAAEAEGAPAFDIVRVEPDGASVIAGRTAPNAKVELLRDGKPYASAAADASGQFALTPPDLPPGSSEIALRAFAPDGKALPGRESVTVVVSEKRDAKPLIALSAPDAPTRVLSQPDAPEAGAGRPATAFAEPPGRAAPDAKATDPGKPAESGKPAERREAARTGANRAESGGGGTGIGGGRTPDAGASPTREAARPAESARDEPASGAAAQAGREAAPRIVSIDAQDGGRLDVTAQAPLDSTLRLYLNDTLVASGRPGPDGRIAFTIGRGVRAGAYQIRVDSVDPAGGKVRRRAEVSFTYPESAARVATAEKPAAEASGARRAAESRTDHRAADHKPAEGAAVPSAPKAAAPSAGEPKPGPTASGPDAKPAAPTMAEGMMQERRPGGTGPAEAQGGASRPGGLPVAEPRPGASPTGRTQAQAPAQRPDPRPAEGATGPTSPSAPAPTKAAPSQASPETRSAPSLAGDPTAVPPPAAPFSGTATPGTPSVAAGTGVGAPKPATDGAAAAALAPKLPESAAPAEAGRMAEVPGPSAGTVFVPEISTARITRGDSLWQISRRTYGKGNRYTVIYDANQEQIRDPDLIYPGQIFVLPKDAPAAADNPAPKRT
jgi:nucleoid-associated protein YgaU